MKKLSILLIIITSSLCIYSQNHRSVEEWVRLIADNVIKDNKSGFIDQSTGHIYSNTAQLEKPGMDVQLLSRYSHFYYHNGVINIAMMDLGEILNEPKYMDYTINTVNFIFQNMEYFKERAGEESKWRFPFGQVFAMEELDDCGAMGASIIDAYDRKTNEVYMPYLEKAGRFVMEGMTRLEDETYARRRPVEMTIWADDLYMSVPFLARMGKLKEDVAYFDMAVRQVLNFHHYLWDEHTGLYFHSWHSDEKENGLARWGRANGWVMMAKIELLEYLPEDHPGRQKIINSLITQIKGVARYQSPTGFWHQLLDKEDSFLETSCTAMFSRGVAYSVNKGYLPERYIAIAQKGWEAISTRIHTYNSVTVSGICSGTGIGNNLNYYYTRETNPNDVGFGAVISAAVELIKYDANTR